MKPPEPRRTLAALALLSLGFACGRLGRPGAVPAPPGVPPRTASTTGWASSPPSPAWTSPMHWPAGEAPPPAGSFPELLALLSAAAGKDPSAAPAFHEAGTLLLAAWARRDPEAAWAVARTLTGEAAPTACETVLAEVARTDAALAWGWAADYARDHPDQAASACSGALQGILRAGDYPAAARLLGTAPPPGGEDRAFLASVLARDWGRNEPAAAAQWALSLPGGPAANEPALTSLCQGWAQTDPAAAADFIASLPPGAVRQSVATQTLLAWAAADPGRASEWLNRLDPHPDFDQPAYEIAVHTGERSGDFDTALSWAEAIVDPALRRQALGEVLVDWIRRDRAAAQTHLATASGLEPETRAELQRALDPRP